MRSFVFTGSAAGSFQQSPLKARNGPPICPAWFNSADSIHYHFAAYLVTQSGTDFHGFRAGDVIYILKEFSGNHPGPFQTGIGFGTKPRLRWKLDYSFTAYYKLNASDPWRNWFFLDLFRFKFQASDVGGGQAGWSIATQSHTQLIMPGSPDVSFRDGIPSDALPLTGQAAPADTNSSFKYDLSAVTLPFVDQQTLFIPESFFCNPWFDFKLFFTARVGDIVGIDPNNLPAGDAFSDVHLFGSEFFPLWPSVNVGNVDSVGVLLWEADFQFTGYPRLRAAFKIAQLNGVSATFADLTLGNPISWTWNFGDGSVSNDQNPVHVFPRTGDYIVTLTVANAFGEVKVHSAVVTIPLVAKFAFTMGSYPQVQFTDQSSGVVTWDWDFGDGSPHSNQRNPSHAFLTPNRDYIVQLTITDGAGNTTTAQRTVHIGPVLVADFSFAQVGSPAHTAQFTDRSTGNVVAWNWVFFFGLQQVGSNQKNPLFTYPGQVNSQPVRLTITDAFGSTSTIQRLVSIT